MEPYFDCFRLFLNHLAALLPAQQILRQVGVTSICPVVTTATALVVCFEKLLTLIDCSKTFSINVISSISWRKIVDESMVSVFPE